MTIDCVDENVSVFRAIEAAETSRRRRRIRRALFPGPCPDRSVYVKMMLAEQFVMDRKRMIERYAFDISTGQPVEQQQQQESRDAKRSPRKSAKSCDENKENDEYKSKRNKENLRPGSSDHHHHHHHSSPKKSLKMTGDKSYLRSGRQSQMTDYWNYRKISESSCSDKEN